MRRELFAREDSYILRGIAVLMVIGSHYAEWCAGLLAPELSRFLMKLGDYGVDLFFLMSGYALVKTSAGKRVDRRFLIKRLKNVYFPYLILAGIIELIAGGAVTADRIKRYLLGMDYWFIFNILVLYLLFYLIWKIGDGEEDGKRAAALAGVRLLLLGAAVIGFSGYLYLDGRREFWYVSNGAFFVGALCGQYEKPLLLTEKRWQPIGLVVLTALMIGVAKSGMRQDVWLTEGQIAPAQITANLIWTLLVLCLPRLLGRTREDGLWHRCRIRTESLWGRAADGALRGLMFVGRISLYLYLTHTCVYYQVITYVDTRQRRQNWTALALTLVISGLLWALVEGALRLPGRKRTRSGSGDA